MNYYFMIGKFRFATPGRLGNYNSGDKEEEQNSGETTRSGGDSQPERIIALLGGRENIVLVDACMTRLRVTVKDAELKVMANTIYDITLEQGMMETRANFFEQIYGLRPVLRQKRRV